MPELENWPKSSFVNLPANQKAQLSPLVRSKAVAKVLSFSSSDRENTVFADTLFRERRDLQVGPRIARLKTVVSLFFSLSLSLSTVNRRFLWSISRATPGEIETHHQDTICHFRIFLFLTDFWHSNSIVVPYFLVE